MSGALANPASPPADGLPRWFNFLSALLGLCLLSPFLALISLLIRTDSPGPPLFAQRRLGRRGRAFTCYKFRSMMAGSGTPPRRIDQFDTYFFQPPGAPRDRRLTPLGAVLRRTSVDELPQLLNVLRGEMALVGPRPELPEIVAQYPAAFHRRHTVLPGLSGLAQIRGRSDLTYAVAVAYDLDYIDRRSPRQDLEILRKTIAAVFRTVGAR